MLGLSTPILLLSTVLADLPIVPAGAPGPLADGVRAVLKAMDEAGAPPPNPVRSRIEAALRSGDARAIQEAVDGLCLVGVTINPEGRVRSAEGPAPARLTVGRRRAFLVKVTNEAGVTAELALRPRQGGRAPWLSAELPDRRPLAGLPLEYRLLLLSGRAQGKREETLVFEAGRETEDLGARGEVAILFNCREEGPTVPARP